MVAAAAAATAECSVFLLMSETPTGVLPDVEYENATLPKGARRDCSRRGYREEEGLPPRDLLELVGELGGGTVLGKARRSLAHPCARVRVADEAQQLLGKGLA